MNTLKKTCDFVYCRKIIHVDKDLDLGFCKFHFKVEKQKFKLFVGKFGLADVKEGINRLFFFEKDEYRELEQKAIKIVNDSEKVIPIVKDSDKQFHKWWLDWVWQEKIGENVK